MRHRGQLILTITMVASVRQYTDMKPINVLLHVVPLPT